MRKHFLILMLMTLLPLAGWAESYEVKVRAMALEIYYGAANPTGVQSSMFMVTDWAGYPGGVDDKAAVSDAIKAKLSFTSERAANSNVGNIPFTLSVADGDFVQYGGDYFFINIANANGTFKQLKADAPIITPPAYVTSDLVYTSNEHSLLNAEALGTATVGTLTVCLEYAISTYDGAWSVPGDGDWGAENYKVTNAGKYKVLYRAVPSDNYEPAGDELAEKVVAPADLTAAWEVEGATPTANTWTYDTQTHPLVIAPTDAISFGTTEIPYEYCATNSTDDEEWTTDLSGFTAASNTENKTVYWRVKETANYTGHAATALTATINKATPEFTELPTFAESKAYDGQEVNLITSAGTATLGATPTFETRVAKPNGIQYWAWSGMTADTNADNFKKTNATKVQIRYSTQETADLDAVVVSDPTTIIISKATIDAESFTAPAAIEGLVYDGNAKALVAAASWGENTPAGTFQYSLDNTNWYDAVDADDVKGTAAGNYSVYFKVVPTDATNYAEYVLAEPIAAAIGKATIPAESFNAPGAATGLKADGNAHALVTAASWIDPNNYGTFQYSLDNTNWYDAVDANDVKGTAAGNYSVYFKIVPTDATNYEEYVAAEPIAVTIGGYTPVYIVPTAAQKYYGTEDPASFEYTVVNATTSETLDNSVLKGTVSLARTNGNAIGTYKIYVKDYTPAAEDGDYTVVNILNTPASEDAANKTAVFTILVDPNAELKLNFTADAIANKASKVYDGTTSIEALAFTVDDLEADETTLIGDDTWASLKGSATVVFALAAENGNAQETQVTATVSGGLTARYATVTVTPMDFEITPAAITLYAKDQAINWSVDPTAQPNTTVEDATVEIAAGALKGTDALTDVVASINIAGTNVGNNNITLTAATNANYNITVNKDAGDNDKIGNLSITGAATLAMTSDYDADDDWFSTIQSYNGENKEVKITVNRTQTLLSGKTYTWKGEEWNAFILPFDITPKQLSDAFGYAIVNVVNPSASTADNIAFKLQMSGTIPANTPFMLKNYEAVAPNTEITLGSFEIVAPTSAEVSVDAGGGWTFIGSYDKKTIDNSNSDIYYYNGEGAWKHLGATSTNTWNIAPFNAYMLQPAAGNFAREITFTFEELDGSATVIKSVSDESTDTVLEGWYTINGIKLESAPTQKGIYIKDGKKVVIK